MIRTLGYTTAVTVAAAAFVLTLPVTYLVSVYREWNWVGHQKAC